MGKFLTLSLGLLLLPLAAGATTPQQEAIIRHLQSGKNPLALMQKAKAGTPVKLEEGTMPRRLPSAAPFLSVTEQDETGYLDGPNGDTWSYALTFTYDVIEHEAYTERLKTGFELSVYDGSNKLVGTVKDKIALGEGDTKVAAIAVDAMVSKKFFNFDDKYEVIINIAMNRPDNSVRTFAQVYSIGAAADGDGDTPVAYTMPGFVCACVNASANSWEENFYMATVTETGFDASIEDPSEFAASNKNVITIYKKADWSGSPKEIGKIEIPSPNLPGDQMSVPYFIADVRNGKPTFIVQHYEKWFFKNAIGPGTGMIPGETEEDGMPFDDNNLVVEQYSYSGYAENISLEKTIKIPADQTTDNSDVMFSYYSIGHLLYKDDLSDDGSSNVCIQRYTRSDDDNYLTSFARYKADGTREKMLATDIDAYLVMSDIRGFESQAMFIKQASDDLYNLTFVDLPSGNEAMTIPSTYQNIPLRTNVDRYPVGESYEYAFQTMQSHYDEDGNILEHVVWINADGDLSHTDVLNLGKNIAMAQVYITQSVLSPYLIDTDEAREYLWLVKRFKDVASTSASDTYLYILSSNGKKLMEFGPDETKGHIVNVDIVNTATNPTLWISYLSDTDPSTYSNDYYALPLAKFANGGDGTAENPYKIATIGDFEQLRAYPEAHFELVADIVADGVDFHTVKDTFKGTLDGKGHSVTGLTTTGSGIFGELSDGAAIRNITFIGARILSVSGSDAGFIAAKASGAELSGIHIFGLDVADSDADVTFGGLVGTASLGTTISNCSLNSSEIALPGAVSVGGMAGILRTGATVSGCSVKATLTAKSELGGIAGTVDKDNIISDCHTDVNLSAGTVVGGIAGYNEGSVISRCYVEGTIKTTGGDSKWYDAGPCAGGIVGSLKSSFTTGESGSSEVLSTPVILNNFVNLSSLEGHTPTVAPEFSEQQKTIHRIVGRTQVNETPEETGYDKDGNPIYGDPYPAELRLKDNYAISTLLSVQADIEAIATTTEGESVDEDKLSADWFATKLGLEYGEGKMWNELADADPALQHEGGNFCAPAEISVPQGELFDINVVFTGNKAVDMTTLMDEFYYTTSDENVADMTGDMSLSKGRVAVRFEAKTMGKTTVDICGAKCEVTVTEPIVGIDTILGTAEGTLTFDGEYVLAEGCTIDIYNIAGTRMATGRDSVRVASLAPGIYIAKGTAAGTCSSLKFIVK